MSTSRLNRDFFALDTLTVARELLGQRLVRILNNERLSGRIVEVEAYVGEDDQASHARPGRTKRNAPMYGPPGYAYVYLIYGMHHCFNVVTESEGFPAAVLIRALEPMEGIKKMQDLRGGRPDLPLTSGPARLCQALDIDRHFDGIDLCASDALLFLEADTLIPTDAIATDHRIGVRGDEEAVTVPWRFYVKNNQHVSRR
ncbi:MAG: DNA-3-methyladenine glycosylase [Chloroflexi bacterium]|nr:DNA-3-methyladenine glycosylase [Chloroflexota bacterium]